MIQDPKETDDEQGQNQNNCMFEKNLHSRVVTPNSTKEEITFSL
jgi:hypothetical protein